MAGGGASAADWRAAFFKADSLPPSAPAEEKRARGRAFEEILCGALAEAGLLPRTSYRPPGEEIDGSFVLNGRTFLLEAKWVAEPIPASSLYQFRGKVDGKLVGTIGVFVSMSGYATDAVDALAAGKTVNLILFDGDDVRAVADGDIGMVEALEQKLRGAAETGSPFVAITRPESPSTPTASEPLPPTRVVVVEGRFDAIVIESLVANLGPSKYRLEIIPAGGALNAKVIASSLSSLLDESGSVLVVLDGEGRPDDIRAQAEPALIEAMTATQRMIGLVVLEPDLETAIGLLPEDFAEGRRRVLKLSGSLVRARLKSETVLHRAAADPAVHDLIEQLGLPMDRELTRQG
jgi:Restriction endonuclease